MVLELTGMTLTKQLFRVVFFFYLNELTMEGFYLKH